MTKLGTLERGVSQRQAAGGATAGRSRSRRPGPSRAIQVCADRHDLLRDVPVNEERNETVLVRNEVLGRVHCNRGVVQTKRAAAQRQAVLDQGAHPDDADGLLMLTREGLDGPSVHSSLLGEAPPSVHQASRAEARQGSSQYPSNQCEGGWAFSRSIHDLAGRRRRSRQTSFAGPGRPAITPAKPRSMVSWYSKYGAGCVLNARSRGTGTRSLVGEANPSTLQRPRRVPPAGELEAKIHCQGFGL
jgi:hypothetical protein